MASFGQNPYGSPNPLTPNMIPPGVANRIQTGETIAVNTYLGLSGTAYDQQNKTANRAVQVSTTFSLLGMVSPPPADLLFLGISDMAGMVGYGMELHDALKSHNKKMETEAALGIAMSGIGLGGETLQLLKAAKLISGMPHLTSLLAPVLERVGNTLVARTVERMKNAAPVLTAHEVEESERYMSKHSEIYAKRTLEYAKSFRERHGPDEIVPALKSKEDFVKETLERKAEEKTRHIEAYATGGYAKVSTYARMFRRTSAERIAEVKRTGENIYQLGPFQMKGRHISGIETVYTISLKAQKLADRVDTIGHTIGKIANRVGRSAFHLIETGIAHRR